MAITLEQARTKIRKIFNYGYASMEADGQWYWYLKKPKWDSKTGSWRFKDHFVGLGFLRLNVDVSPENSLIRVADTEQRGLGYKY